MFRPRVTKVDLLAVPLVMMCAFEPVVIASENRISSSADTEVVRSNGSDWIEFGPAIINECKRIDFFQGFEPATANGHSIKNEFYTQSDLSKPKIVTSVIGDRGFEAAKQWVKNNVANNLNASPEVPSARCAEPENTLILYSSKDAKPWLFMPHVASSHLSRDEQRMPAIKDVLLVVPLSSRTLTFDTSPFEKRISTLKEIMGVKQDAATGTCEEL